jgi:hypothetical protein
MMPEFIVPTKVVEAVAACFKAGLTMEQIVKTLELLRRSHERTKLPPPHQ